MKKSAKQDASRQAASGEIPRMEVRQCRRANPEKTTIQFRTCKSWPDARYYLAHPETVGENMPVLVSVHGISRNARAHAEIFARHCGRLGWAVVAPLFTASRFPKYQQLGFSRTNDLPRSDLALDAILDEVASLIGARTDKVYMFGFSGGGQFVHRYGMINPHRVIAEALGAPGWFTFPDTGAPFPRGVRVTPRDSELRIDWRSALEIPTAVFVGQQDLDRDDSLNTARKIDDQQGRTRPERGRRWVAAMRAAARMHGLDARHEFYELYECGHSFADCISVGRLDLGALDFLIRAGMPARTPSVQQHDRGRRALSFWV